MVGTRMVLMLWGLLCAVPAGAQDAGEPPPPPAVAEAVRLGRAMVVAPLCGLRDGRWAFDLRQGLESRSQAPAGTTEGALGYAEAEALEDFATHPGAATCTPLAGSAELKDADRVVAERRAGRPAS